MKLYALWCLSLGPKQIAQVDCSSIKLVELFFWLLTELIKFIQRVQYRRQIKKEIEKFKDSTIVTVLNFEADSLPEEMRTMKVIFQGALVDNGTIVEKDQEVATFIVGDKVGRMHANKAGKIKFAKPSK